MRPFGKTSTCCLLDGISYMWDVTVIDVFQGVPLVLRERKPVCNPIAEAIVARGHSNLGGAVV